MRIRVLLGSLMIAFTAPPIRAQTANIAPATLADSLRRTIEAASDASDVDAADAAAALAERALALYPADAMLQHYRAYALYRAGSMVYGRFGSGRARPYFEKARDILEHLVEQPTIPESYALLASVYGMQIATAKIQMLAGMRLGSKSNSMMDRAVAAGPDNARVWVMRGIGAFNTPSTFGGGLDKAEAHLKHAIQLFANDKPEAPLPAWGLADAHIWLGQVYARQKKKEAARAEFEEARTLQPRNAWITTTLLPSLEKLP